MHAESKDAVHVVEKTSIPRIVSDETLLQAAGHRDGGLCLCPSRHSAR